MSVTENELSPELKIDVQPQEAPRDKGLMDFGRFCDHHGYVFSSPANQACTTHQKARQHYSCYCEGRYFSWSPKGSELTHQSWSRQLKARLG